MITEEDVRRIVREEIDAALFEEGGVYDTSRTAAINALIALGLGRAARAGDKPS